MTSSIMYSLVTLTIGAVTPFLQLMDVKTYVKIHVLAQTRVMGNSKALFKTAESLIQTLKASF